MRLLNSSTLRLHDCSADKIPTYAILSHTWRKDQDEVLFADMERNSAENRAGYQKIRYACTQAKAAGLDYIWVDTCCIDKDSSAELSEAINSMYSWYQKAKICYAYLADVSVSSNTDVGTLNSAIAASRWFTRGWTLQELIGSSNLIFYSCEWIEIGTKSSLHNVLAEVTGIDVKILTNEIPLESTSLGNRMSWASKRETTRVEDMAYCLMGLFDVNMPLLYGEGEKSFIRLQEEIIKHSDDHSLFAWTDPTADADDQYGMLAKKPKHFEQSGNIMPYREWEDSAPFSISNKGLRIELHLSPFGQDLFVAALECLVPPHYEEFLGIYLRRALTGTHQYVRVRAQTLGGIPTRGSITTLYVRQRVDLRPLNIYPLHAFQLRKGPSRYKLIGAVVPSKSSDPSPVLTSRRWPPGPKTYTFQISKKDCQLAGVLLLERSDDKRLTILLGSRTDFGVGFEAAPNRDIGNLEELQRSFKPQAPGTDVVLEDHKVCVNVEPQVHGGAKYYMVDIIVEALFPPPNPLDVIREVIPGLQSQTDERPPTANTNPPRGFRKFKASFKSQRAQDSHKDRGDI